MSDTFDKVICVGKVEESDYIYIPDASPDQLLQRAVDIATRQVNKLLKTAIENRVTVEGVKLYWVNRPDPDCTIGFVRTSAYGVAQTNEQ